MKIIFRIDPGEFSKRQIPDDAVEMLQTKKLIVLEPFSLSHADYPCGRRIVKPISAGGNVLPFENRIFEGVRCDAPPTILYWQDEKWIIEISLPLGGENAVISHPTLEDAIQNTLDLYFGDPERMHQLHQFPYDSPDEAQAEAVSLAKKIINDKDYHVRRRVEIG